MGQGKGVLADEGSGKTAKNAVISHKALISKSVRLKLLIHVQRHHGVSLTSFVVTSRSDESAVSCSWDEIMPAKSISCDFSDMENDFRGWRSYSDNVPSRYWVRSTLS